ncbi:acyltransferase family protein [Weissella kandleri]|uniref:acyltransferase family protein n=1 Tax=Weissella kandleri TaxID=1616 RepID=UPI00387E830E
MNRIEWVDVAKGWTILMVLLVHVLEGLYKTGAYPNQTQLLQSLMAGLFLFIMPLFFALSGYLYRAPKTWVAWRLQMQKKMIALMGPSMIFTVLYVGLQQMGGENVHNEYQWSDVLLMFVHPVGYLWFLETLFLIFALVGVLTLLKLPAGWQMLLYLVLAVIGNFIWTPLILQEVCWWTSAFYLGYLMRQEARWWQQTWVVGGAILVIVAGMLWRYDQGGAWFDTNLPALNLILPKLATIIVGFNVFQKIQGSNYWVRVGQASLTIYLVHAPLASMVRIGLTHLGLHNFWLLLLMVSWLTWQISIWIVQATDQAASLQLLFYPYQWWQRRHARA